MPLTWLKRSLELTAIKSNRKDLERFIASLRSQPENEIAALVAVATSFRLRLREAGHLPDEVLQINSANEYEQTIVRHRVSRMVRTFHTSSEYLDAAGAMVWLHTLRALTIPELRPLGMGMWQQLERGFQQTADALAEIESATHRAAPQGTLLACAFIPEDLNPSELTA
jgi:hypothetical protein